MEHLPDYSVETDVIDALIDLTTDIARWLHVLAAVAWMGFGLWLRRLAMRARPLVDSSAELEVWDTHSLGFWRTAKITQPQASDIEGLVWSFNQIRWLFGTGLLLFGLIYYRQPQIYLLDPNDPSLSSRAAIALSLAGLTGAALINEAINRIPLRRKAIYNFACAFHLLAWTSLYANLYSQQGAMIQIGAMLGTTITTNILGYLYPATREATAALMRGERPDPTRKQYWDRRNQHSFLLPAVVFLMLSSHMGSVIKANGHAFTTIAAVLVLSVVSRYVLESIHRNSGTVPPRLGWVVAAAAFAVAMALAWLIGDQSGANLQALAEATFNAADAAAAVATIASNSPAS
ncbi:MULTISPECIES: urate hydroxylase PuuD [unclassified Lysobacter]|uniref:urate hydroxylase PuuD n=1 Tax=unclassified Lysobacter TaxID=2635362 RepID=UPI001BEB95A2|nr:MULTISPECIES: urate hydroxylase PuuD [unclassified Lysobacter]MBT2748729.1 urate hydroxylase PuuD [Lysobacter sp. ISL-42]MBT2751664.1 urate hydroxylase PuuD [Lysobacter sp. ISL-50]MBT2775858.1 urate hydroxylase PuuD [Lysobacter sp. ISL-54]MBT2782178.1 urate hydroxylase PuuD [Lysobacter sp. ISL-52]